MGVAADEDELDLAGADLRVGRAERDGWRRIVGPLLPLMEHQDLAVARCLATLRGDGAAGVVCVPTGGGKTRIGAEVLVQLIADSRFKVLWLAHKIELVDQAVEGILKVAVGRGADLRLGRFQAGDRKLDRPADCVVASIASVNWGDNLDRLLATMPRFDLVVVDECHHTVARTWRSLVATLRQMMPGLRVLGLSATPFREDDLENKALQQLFGAAVLHEVGATELIEKRVLAVPLFQEVTTNELMTFAGGFARAAAEADDEFKPWQLAQIASRQARNRLMVDAYLGSRVAWGPTLIFACTIDHCEQIAKMLKEAGLQRVSAVHGDTSRMSATERRETIAAFKEGKLEVLVSAMLLTEGTDFPQVRSVFMARPTRSPILFRQMIGRGLRGPWVGGTPECNIVLFRDTFSDHVVGALANRLAWLAGLDGMNVALRELDRRDLERARAEADASDPVLVEARRRKRQALERRLAGLIVDVGLAADEHDRRLEGWWELPLDGGRAPLILPGFRGADAVRSYIDGIIAAIASGGAAPRGPARSAFDLGVALSGGAELSPFELGFGLYLRATAFGRTALRLRRVPQWVDIESMDAGERLEIGPDEELPEFVEEYQRAGRELLRSELSLLVRRCVRGVVDWSLADAELWKRHVAGRDEWVRLQKRSEEFFPRKEWRALIAAAQAEFFEARPDDS